MKILKTLSFFTFFIFFTSCMTIKDQIWVNKDGTGKREMMIDMSEAYPMMKMGLAQELNKEEEEEGDEPESESEKELRELFARAMENGKIDTLMSPEDKENNNPYVSDQKVRLQIDDAKSLFAMTIIQDIKDVYKMDFSETGSNDMMNMNESPTGQSDNPFAGLLGGGGDESFPKINLEPKLLTIKKKKGEKSDDGENAEMEQMMDMFAGKGSYTYIVHFPKKVKKISGEGVTKKDKKTIEMVIPLKELLNPESEYNVSVKFK